MKPPRFTHKSTLQGYMIVISPTCLLCSTPQLIKNRPLVVFMKGDPSAPMVRMLSTVLKKV